MTPGEEIVAWLEGLERCRERVVAVTRDPVEREEMKARRGIYEGVAADIRSKWPRLFVKCAGQSESAGG
jgi:hypothetical protein